jgi:glycerol kinase
MIDNWEDVRRAHEADDLAFGTVKSWIAYVSLELPRSLYTPRAPVIERLDRICLVAAGQHISEVSNASRTLLLNIRTLEWDPVLLQFFQHTGIGSAASRLDERGVHRHLAYGPLRGVPLGGLVGDQQGALIGNKPYSGRSPMHVWHRRVLVVLHGHRYCVQ